MADENAPTAADASETFRQAADIWARYANSVRYESSVWDLKILFGQLDQSKVPLTVNQHTAISVSWLQAKIMAYFLVVNLSIHQAENGNVPVPLSVLPPRPDESTVPDEKGKNVFKYLSWIHDQFFGSDPYIPPGVDSQAL